MGGTIHGTDPRVLHHPGLSDVQVWLLATPAAVRGALLVVLLVATGASQLGRTVFLRRREGVTTWQRS